MAHRLSRKFVRNAGKVERWRSQGAGAVGDTGISPAALAGTLDRFVGEVILPGDKDYDEKRKLYNPVFQAFPSCILMCETEVDAQLAVIFAAQSQLFLPPPGGNFPQPVTVRSGGHSTAGYSAGSGPLVDVSKLDCVVIGGGRSTVTVGCGCSFGKLIQLLDAEALHVPTGECDDVCVGGFVQGGGYGFTSGAFGLNSDNVVSFRVLLADGSIVTASEIVNWDLWWALRGGTGGNFGIVLSVTYKVQPMSQIYGWAIAWPLESPDNRSDATAAMVALQTSFMKTAPQYVTTQVMVCYQPSDPHGAGGDLTPWLLMRGTYAGPDPAEGPTVMAPLMNMPGATVQYSGTGSYGEITNTLLTFPYQLVPIPPEEGFPNEDKGSRYVARDLSQQEWRSLLDFFVEQAPSAGNLWSMMYFEIYGGAINAYPAGGSAFIHRDVAFNACLDVFWSSNNGDPTGPRALLSAWKELVGPMWNGHIYQNYPEQSAPDYRANYWGSALDLLVQVKAKYDPQNFFTFAQMVSPYPTGEATSRGADQLPPNAARALQEPIAIERAPLRL